MRFDPVATATEEPQRRALVYNRDLGGPLRQPLPRPDIERHIGPAPVVDVQLQRDKRFRHRIRIDALLLAVSRHRPATDRARHYFTGYPPSSPSVGLLRNGELVYMLERRQIETRSADEIAAELSAAFDTFCATEAVRN